MDWARAIAINHTALTRIVATLIAMVRLTVDGIAARLSRPTYRAVLMVLRPAEAAVRRLIVIAARGIVVKPQAVRAMPKGLKIAGKGSGSMAFQLIDTRQRFHPWRPKRIPDHKAPRVWSPWTVTPPNVRVYRPEDFGKPEPVTDGSVDAKRLGRRLMAIKQALANLPAQAQRLVRWRMRRQAQAKFSSPMRPGRPAGHRQKPRDEIDWVLKECHALAREVEREDTS